MQYNNTDTLTLLHITRNMLRTHDIKIVIFGEKIKFVAPDLVECLKQIEYQVLLLTCAPISGLPSNTSTMHQAYFTYFLCPNIHIYNIRGVRE